MGKRILIQIIYPWLKLYWFLVRPQTYGVQCVVQHGDAILLVRNTYGRRQWTFPGGSIVRGETAEEAIRREVHEEVGLRLESLSQLGTFEAIINYKQDHVAVFAGVSAHRKFKIDPGEILEARWFPRVDLPALATPARQILAMWQREQP
jgi:ADP-ribose pyrophosphatase YjhB (NUDIX family)